MRAAHEHVRRASEAVWGGLERAPQGDADARRPRQHSHHPVAPVARPGARAGRIAPPPSPPRTPHPVADVLTLELMPCFTRGRVGALRGRHTTTTY